MTCLPPRLEKQPDSTSKTTKEEKGELWDLLLYIPPVILERPVSHLEGDGSEAQKRKRWDSGEQGRRKAKKTSVNKVVKNTAAVENWTITSSANARSHSVRSSGIAAACTEQISSVENVPKFMGLREAEEIPELCRKNAKRTRPHLTAEPKLKDSVAESASRTKLSIVSEEPPVQGTHAERKCYTEGNVLETDRKELCKRFKDFDVQESPPGIYEQSKCEKDWPPSVFQSSSESLQNCLKGKEKLIREPSPIRRQHKRLAAERREEKYEWTEDRNGFGEARGPTAIDDIRCTVLPIGSAPPLKRSVLRTSGEMPLFTLAGFIHASLGLAKAQDITILCCGQALRGSLTLRDIGKFVWQNQRCPIALEYNISEAQKCVVD